MTEVANHTPVVKTFLLPFWECPAAWRATKPQSTNGSPGRTHAVHMSVPGVPSVQDKGAPSVFDITKYIPLLPNFRESEVDPYFAAFERIACDLDWPRKVGSLLLQCKLRGRAQKVITSLPLADGLNYKLV